MLPAHVTTTLQEDDPFSKFMREQENGSGTSGANGKKDESAGAAGRTTGSDGKSAGTGTVVASSEASAEDMVRPPPMLLKSVCLNDSSIELASEPSRSALLRCAFFQVKAGGVMEAGCSSVLLGCADFLIDTAHAH